MTTMTTALTTSTSVQDVQVSAEADITAAALYDLGATFTRQGRHDYATGAIDLAEDLRAGRVVLTRVPQQ